MDPPETPITAQTYKELGLPFYNLLRDECKEPGVAGEWGWLNGVAETEEEYAKIFDKGKPAEPKNDDGGSQEEVTQVGQGKQEKVVEIEEFEEALLDFPVQLLDVDDAVPPFRGAVRDNDDDEDW